MKTITLLCAVLVAGAQGQQPGPADPLVGTWVGEIVHEGESAPVALEFERRGDEVHATLVVPAFHGRAPLGPAVMNGGQIELRIMTLDYDRRRAELSVTLPEGIVPRYRPRMVLRRSKVPFRLPERPEPSAPRREPVWTATVGSPIWADAAYRDGRVVVGADDGVLRAIDARTGQLLWAFETGGAIRARAVFDGPDVLVPSDNGLLHRVDAATGALGWQVRVAGRPANRVPLSDPQSRYENRASAVARRGERLFIGTYEGRVLALRASTGERLWEFTAGDSVVTTPAVADGRVYVGSFDHHVYALDETTGGLIWKYDTGEAVTSDVVPDGDRVIVGSRSYDLQALDARRGTPQWKNYFWFSWVESSPAIRDGTIYIGSSDAAKVFAIDVVTGKTRWATDALGSAWGQPAVTDSTLFEGTAGVLGYSAPHRGAVLALDRQSGTVKWWYEAAPPAPGGRPMERMAYGFAASLAVGEGLVFAPGLDGRIYAFEQ